MRNALVFFALIVVLVEASCPNKCSGHGSCGASDVCQCRPTWIGGDCSERECPFVRAWVDVAQHQNDAHYYAECGNRGKCDRATGQCECDLGYTGKGCRRMTCPNQCSGHGTCEFIEEFATDTDKRVGGSSSNTYAAWDTEKIVGCKCDAGWNGHDCTQRMCPKGDDPLTTSQVEMKQIIKTNTDSTIYLSYQDPYGAIWTTGKINNVAFNDGASYCASIQVALRRLPNHALDSVLVDPLTAANPQTFSRSVADSSAGGSGTSTSINFDITTEHQCLVTFPSAPGTTGYQHLLGCHVGVHNTNGMQPVSAGASLKSCIVYEWAHDSTSISSLVLTELATCSNRGVCDGETGQCLCFAGHKGTACETQEALV